jgi:ATP citrate (pro-S)-lyase
MNSNSEGDTILFTHEGGVEVGDVDAKALRLEIPVCHHIHTLFVANSAVQVSTSGKATMPARDVISSTILTHVPDGRKDALLDFLIRFAGL